MKKFLKEFQGWICLAGVVLLHFSDTRYVTKNAYDEDRKKDAAEAKEFSGRLMQDFSDVKQSLALLQQSAKTLEDHESRLRHVEKRNL